MTERIWTRAQYGKLSELQKKYRLPEEVVEEVHRVVDILDTYYGSERDVDRDEGGYLLLITECIDMSKYLRKLLDKYHTNIEDAEIDDILCDDNSTIWKSVLYLIANDYAVTFVYPCKIPIR